MSEYLEVGTKVRYVGGRDWFDDDEELIIIDVDSDDEEFPYLAEATEDGMSTWLSEDEVEPW